MTETSAAPGLAPIAASERIHALDIIRGVALIGIFLMNVEWFTRPIADLGTGVDASQTGINYLASWFVYTFVQGKFWTMFSLLFGMGFAVMLGRAEQTERAFVAPYVRRIIGLFLFGSAHYVLLWPGDILHNYAFTAGFLLLIVTRSWKAWLALLLSIVVIGYGFHADSLLTSSIFAALAMACALVVFRGGIDRWYKLVLLVLAAVSAAISVGPTSEGMAVTAGVLAVVAVFMFALEGAPLARFYKLGAGFYLLPFTLATLFVLATIAVPALKPAPPPEAQRAERMAERDAERSAEIAVLTTGTYLEAVRHRADKYREELPQSAGMAMIALPLFMIGFWFVRSGVIGDLRGNLPMFKRLTLWALPIGLAFTLLSVSLNATFAPGTGRDNVVALARTTFELGTLPLCLGYVAGLVWLLSTRLGQAVLAPLRHAGRMALTNYLGASLFASLFFYGYGLGYFGQVPRAGQVLFVFGIFSLQLAFSYLWLSRYLYGPMEWLWRAITYWQLPPMRRQREADTGRLAPRTTEA